MTGTRGRSVALAALLLFLGPAGTLVAQTVLQVPAGFSTIQSAIVAAQGGEVILVQPGVYAENVDFIGKAVELRSVAGPAATVIDGGQSGSVVSFVNGEGSGAHLVGFTLTNGLAAEGGGIHCANNSSPTIDDCIVRLNMALAGYGAGLASVDAAPLVRNTVFTGNWSMGGAGGAVACIFGTGPTLVNCTLYGNLADFGGGLSTASSSPTLVNCILWSNAPTEVDAVASAVLFDHCDVSGGWTGAGAGNIASNPLFVDGAAEDFHLANAASPCIDAGVTIPSLPTTDWEGDIRAIAAAPDIGVDEAHFFAQNPAADGTLTSGSGSAVDLLFVNGTVGGVPRIVPLPAGSALNVSVVQPPGNPAPAPFAIFAVLAEPDYFDALALPFGIGAMSFAPCPLVPTLQPFVFTLAGTVGLSGCPAVLQAFPAPWGSGPLFLPPFSFDLTLQAVIEMAPGALGTTNAVSLHIG